MFRPPSGPRAEVVEEQGLKATIPEIAPITDAVSLSVQAMYETNPYPPGRISRAGLRSTCVQR